MITRDFLQKKGFKLDTTSPNHFDDYGVSENFKGYITIRFRKEEEEPCSLYAFSGHPYKTDGSVRKVVLNDCRITDEDLEMAKQICRL